MLIIVGVLSIAFTFIPKPDALGVVATKECIWCVVHVFGSHAETNHGMVYDAVVLERPQVVQFRLLDILVRRQAEYAIRLLSKTLRSVKC